MLNKNNVAMSLSTISEEELQLKTLTKNPLFFNFENAIKDLTVTQLLPIQELLLSAYPVLEDTQLLLAHRLLDIVDSTILSKSCSLFHSPNEAYSDFLLEEDFDNLF